MSLKKMFSLMAVDLKMWIRQPKLLLMAILPLVIISLGVGFFMADAEILPVGIIVENQDSESIRLKDYIMNLKSGTDVTWFDATDIDVEEKYENGELLGKIIIPANLSEILENGQTADIPIYINNINDDVTKNFIQRMQYAINCYNEGLHIDNKTYYIPRVEFDGDISPDLSLIQYICASVLGLSILLSASLAIVFSIAREFEDKTIKELIMGPNFGNILGGKLLSSIAQCIIIVLFIFIEEWIIFGFLPKNLCGQILLLLGGVLFSAGIAMIIATKSKQVLPAGIAVMVLNIGSWWLSGGLAPAEAWTGLLRTLADFWPGTYYYQSYINVSLLENISSKLLYRYSLIVGIFGIILLLLAYKIFSKEAKEV
jgi:hypothetical protein